MTKVCLISPIPPPSGGIAQWTCHVLQASILSKDIRFVHISSSQARNNVLSGSVLIKVIGGVGVILRVLPRYFKALLSGIDVSHLSTSGYIGTVRDLLILLISRIFFNPVVYHLHFGRLPELSSRGGWEWTLLRLCISLSAHVIVLDNHTFACVKDRFPDKGVSLIPNPIDLFSVASEADMASRNFEEVSASNYVLYLGWLLPTKGIQELLQAWSQVSRPGFRLVLAGPCLDDYKKELLSFIDDESVVFLGEVSHSDAMRLLRDASFLVLPSHTEAFPNVLLEAMALSKAVVATNVGAIPDILASSCGLIVPPKNVGDLILAIQGLIDDEGLCHTLGVNGQIKCQTSYDVTVVLRSYVALWKMVASS